MKLFREGSGSTMGGVGGGRGGAGVRWAFEKKVNMGCGFCPRAEPLLSSHMAQKMGKNINFLFKSNRALIVGLPIALS